MNTCQAWRGRKLLGALIDLSPDLDTFCGASISVVSPSARPGCTSSPSPTEMLLLSPVPQLCNKPVNAGKQSWPRLRFTQR